MGKMYAAGLSSSFNLDSTTYVQLENVDTWAKVSAGADFILAIRDNGTLWALGSNLYGQLGLGDKVTRTTFTQVGSAKTWSAVSCGEYYTLALKSDGTLWAAGRNNYGQTGLGAITESMSFAQVGSDTNWSKIATSYTHSFAIKTTGTMHSTGHNNNGQLGQNYPTNRNTFGQIGSDTNWDEIACGYEYTMAIKTTGALYGTGLNDDNQLGHMPAGPPFAEVFTQEDTLGTDWIKVTCGEAHTLALKNANTLYGVGIDDNGQLGGIGNQSNFTQIGSYTDWSEMFSTGASSFGIRSGGTIYDTGDNNTGLLALGDTNQRTAFTVVGSHNKWITCTISVNGAYSEFSVALQSTIVYGKHMSICGGIRFDNKELIGSALNGKIYQLDSNAYTDAGTAVKRIRRTQIVSADNKWVIHDKVQLEFEPGVGLEGEDEPTVTLKWSDDGGNNWTDGIALPIGAFEDYTRRVIWRRLGKARQRIYEVSTSDPVKFILMDAYAGLRALQG